MIGREEKFYAGGFLYNSKTNAVLLHKRDNNAKVNPNSWAFFGGLNEGDETPKQTFLREVKEELSIDILKENVRELCDYFNNELNTYRYVFFAESNIEKQKMRLTEGEDFDWIPMNKVFEYNLTEKTRRDLNTFLNRQK